MEDTLITCLPTAVTWRGMVDMYPGLTLLAFRTLRIVVQHVSIAPCLAQRDDV